MNVLHIISGDLWAGAEVQAYSLIRAIAQLNNYNIHVITFNDGILAAKLSMDGILTTVLDEHKFSLVNLTSECLQTMKLLQPNIVHTHGFKENFIGGISSRLSTNSTVIRTHHGRGMIGAALRYNMIELMNAKFLTDRIIVVSHDLMNYLRKYGFPSIKIKVIHNGINPINPIDTVRAKELRAELGIPENSKIIGTVGRLVPVKDHRTFLEGAKLVLGSEPHTRFIIIGDGPLLGELKKLAYDLDIISQVCFSGFREDASNLISIFDVFCLTSLHEGVPMALLEAMSLGKPIVATCVGGVGEVVEDRSSGLLVSSGDVRSFANACIKILRDENLVASLSKQAFSVVRDRFLLDNTVKLTQDLYYNAERS